MNDHDIETLLRESLQRNALRAPAGDQVVGRMLGRLERSERPERPARPNERLSPPGRRWRRWALPLAVAGAVGIAGTVVAVAQIERPDSSPAVTLPPRPATTTGASLVASTPSAGPASSALPSRSAQSTAVTGATGPARERTQPAVPDDLHDIQIADVAFTGTNDGWLLGTAECHGDANGADRCSTLLRTTDGGDHWSAAKAPPAPVEGAGECTASDPCVQRVLFANTRTGYAFGADVLFLTTDGAQTWTRQPGMGADALRILGDTVIVARAVNTACPRRCPLFDTSTVGSTRWTPFTVPDPPAGITTVVLTGRGNRAQLLLSSVDLAKGNGRDQTSRLYLSVDGGRRWTDKGERCPYVGAGYTDQSVSMTMAADGTIVVDCATRSAAEPNVAGGLTITSTDGGEHFAVPPFGGKLSPVSAFAAASSTVQLAYAVLNDRGPALLYRSTDSGSSWSPVRGFSGVVSWIAFQSPTVGRIVSGNGRALWTSHDAGATWTRDTLP